MEYHLKTPVPEDEVKKLRAGDLIYVTGTVITARVRLRIRRPHLNAEPFGTSPVDIEI